MTKADWIKERSNWNSALCQAARAIGKDKPLYRILGSTAYGRFEGESRPGEHLDHVAFGAGYLQGVRFAALNAAKELGLEGREELEYIHSKVRGAGGQL